MEKVTLGQIINELIYPLFAVVGVTLRPLGVFGTGLIVGTVLRHALLYKFQMRFFVPLIFLGTVALFGVTAYARWSSPGTLASLGIGLFIGYMFLERGGRAASLPDEEYGEETTLYDEG